MPAKRRKQRHPSSPSDQKLQRWMDLMACLLRRHYGASFYEIRAEVPAYASARSPQALGRMFERDKDELRDSGVPIAVIDQEDGDPLYRISPREMYLPYIRVATARAAAGSGSAAGGLKAGYRALPTLTFQPDELHVLVDAIRMAIAVGDEAITADAESALRKLTYDFDAPLGAAVVEPEDPRLTSVDGRTTRSLRILGEALLKRKHVKFIYRSMSSIHESREHEVAPYGLFFSSGHWYLAARDLEHGDVRNFRVSRMVAPMMNRAKPQTRDYEIPADFRLAEHARAKAPWELGDGDARKMVVDFIGQSGATRAAAALGVAANDDVRRTFRVRRIDSFARWLLSLGGEAVPVSPPELVSMYLDIARATRAVYADVPRVEEVS